MKENFEKAFGLVINSEGAYSNDPHDPGGETKYGICKRDHQSVDIANLTLDQAKQIYKAEYWDKVRGDDLPYPLDLFVFDAAVNQGTGAAAMLLQKACGVQQDGKIGTGTLAAATPDKAAMFMADRAVRYASTTNADTYLRGWLKRLFSLTLGV